jgi:hypothetical protein
VVRDLSPHGPVRGNPAGDVLPLQRGQVKAVPSIADRAVEAFETNPRPIPVLATAMGLSPRQVRNLLYRRGYDAEVRNELSLPVWPKR